MIFVIGSGPGAVSAAHALISRGEEVTMLDTGLSLEKEKREALRRTKGAASWNERDLAQLRSSQKIGIGGVPKKLVYGSDYMYRDSHKAMNIIARNAIVNASHAQGGFTTAWGASFLSYAQRDIEDWPITEKELAPYYEKVLSFVPFSTNTSHPLPRYPLYTKTPQQFTFSSQAKVFLDDMKHSRSALESNGITFGSSHLAASYSPPKGQGCIYCGLCMHGCPHELIYNSAHTLTTLLKSKRFCYLSGLAVQKIEEGPKRVRIYCTELPTGKQKEFTGDRVFLGAGVYSTTRIMAETLEAYDTPITILDSQYFLFHLLRYQGVTGDVTKEKLMTLNQIFLEVDDSQVDSHSVHMQLYTYNDLFEGALKSILGGGYPLLKGPMLPLLSRMIVGQGYIHSDSSSRIIARLEKGKRGAFSGTYSLTGQIHARAKRTVKRVMSKLLQNRRSLRALALTPFVNIPLPGAGNHPGGSFPMKKSPTGQFSSDEWGRPAGLKRVHLIDASSLPSIPAQTIVFPLMANAYRIAEQFDN